MDSDIGPVVISQSVFHIGLKIFVEKRGYIYRFPEWVDHNWQPSLADIISDEICKNGIKKDLKSFSFEFMKELSETANFDKHRGYIAISQEFRKSIFIKSYDFCSDLYFLLFGKTPSSLLDYEIDDLCVSKNSYKSSFFSSSKQISELEKSISKDNILIESLNRRIDELQLSIQTIKAKIDVAREKPLETRQEIFTKAKDSLNSINTEIAVVSNTEQKLIAIKEKEEKIKSKEQKQSSLSYLWYLAFFLFVGLPSLGGYLYLMASPFMGGYPINHEFWFTRVTAWICLIPMCINGLFIIPSCFLIIYRECLTAKLEKVKGNIYRFDADIIAFFVFVPLMSILIFFSMLGQIKPLKIEIEKINLTIKN